MSPNNEYLYLQEEDWNLDQPKFLTNFLRIFLCSKIVDFHKIIY